jgi:hypothetical protein
VEKEYAIKLNNRFEILENVDDEHDTYNTVYEKWESIKTIIKETKQQLRKRMEAWKH